MKLKFLTDTQMAQASLRTRDMSHNWAPFIEELYKHPNRWAEFPEKVNHSAQAYRVTELYKDIFKTTAGTVTASRTETTFPSWVASSATQLNSDAKSETYVKSNRTRWMELKLLSVWIGSGLTIWKRTSGLTTDVDWRFAIWRHKSLDNKGGSFGSWHQNVVVLSSASWINFDYKFAQ